MTKRPLALAAYVLLAAAAIAAWFTAFRFGTFLMVVALLCALADRITQSKSSWFANRTQRIDLLFLVSLIVGLAILGIIVPNPR